MRDKAPEQKTLSQMSDVERGNVPLHVLRAWQDHITDQEASIKKEKAALKKELDERFADIQKELYKNAGKKTGKLAGTYEGLTVEFNRTKKVDWDQDGLFKWLIAQTPEARTVYGKISYGIHETAYKQADADTKAELDKLRTEKISTSISFEAKE